MPLRRIARDLFPAALAGTSIANAFARCVSRTPRGFGCAGREYARDDFRELLVVAFGKAAAPMARAFHECADGADRTASGLVVGPTPHEPLPAGWRYLQGGHPEPNAGSLAAADAV